MANTLLMALIVVLGVPAVMVGYVGLVEWLLGFLPERHRPGVRPWLWIGPAVLFLVVFLVYPALNTAGISLFNADSTRFVGLANYAYVFTAQDMLIAFKNNILWLVLFTLLTVTFGLIIAVLFDRVHYEAAAKALIFLPMAISFVAAGVIWKLMYDFKPAGLPQTGTVNAILTTAIPSFQPQAWLFNPSTNNPGLIAVGVWMWTGFCMVILSAGLKGIPTEILEAARVDGANEWQVFWRIILPMLSSTITVVATTMIINSLKAFDIIYVMTNGNYGTEVIANRMYKEMFNFHQFGRASAIAVILLLAIIPIMLKNIQDFRRQEALR